MKQGTYNTIKHWDRNLVLKFMSNDVEKLTNYLNEKNIKSLSFIDIGGNVGKWYDELSKNFKINHCEIIEPSSLLCEYMKIKFSNYSNITIHNFGLSNDNGEYYFSQPSITTLEDRSLDLSNEDVNLGLSAGDFSTKLENVDYSTTFYSSNHYLENINKIPTEEITLIKMDTENRDLEILLTMENFLIKNKIKPIIIFEGNCVHFIPVIEAQKLVDDFCDNVGYQRINFETSTDNIYLFPL